MERTAERVPGLRPEHVLAVRGEAPVDLEARNRHNVGGSCHGGEFRLPSGEVLVGWPSHRLPVEGLYQTGATAHPGGSVSGGPGATRPGCCSPTSASTRRPSWAPAPDPRRPGGPGGGAVDPRTTRRTGSSTTRG